MLKHILDAHGGKLPDDVHVVFANTGKEMPQTLEFVAECGERWGVKITWLEYDSEAEDKTREVTFSTASRNGEPFASLIRYVKYPPNPVARVCTFHLKVRRFEKFMARLGIEEWNSVIGLRADEPRRVAKQRRRNDTGGDRFFTTMPMAAAGATKEIVNEWWESQEFNLRLANIGGVTPAGNCDLCFLKGKDTLVSLLREKPELATWWIEQERALGKTFRIDRPSYAELREEAERAERTEMAFTFAEGTMPCMCTD